MSTGVSGAQKVNTNPSSWQRCGNTRINVTKSLPGDGARDMENDGKVLIREQNLGLPNAYPAETGHFY